MPNPTWTWDYPNPQQAVTLHSGITGGDVSTALGYTPTSVTGLTGVQSVAAFKTGLSLVKADVGLGSVDNTADAVKVVLSASKLTTARTINGTSFDGTANITINAVDSTARVPTTRTISTTAPLTGGGDLSANRTLAITAATTGAAGSMSAADKTKLDAISGTNTGDETKTTIDTKLLLPSDGTKFYAGDGTWKLVSGGSGAAWGGITGTLSAQTDLQTAIDAKAPLASPTFSGTVTLPAGTVSLSQMANVATGTVFYRKTASAGAPETQTLATLKTDLGLTGTNSGDQFTAMTTSRILGRVTAGFGAAEELTAAQVKTLLAISSGDVSGLGTAATKNIAVGTSAPGSPAVNDLWVDTN